MRQRENIKRLAAERRGTGQKSLSASFVITGGNEDDIIPAANLAKELGCGSLSYRPDTPFKKTIVSAGYSSKVIDNLKKAEGLSSGDFRGVSELRKVGCHDILGKTGSWSVTI